MKEIMEWVKDILLAVVIAAVILAFFKPIIVQQQSMEPNFHAGDYLIKRIIALPGETIEIKGGEVYIDGQMLQEDYLPGEAISGEMDAVTVPEGQLFVMGDNRECSEDSRSPRVGTIEQSTIVGKVIVRLYPFNTIKTFKGVDYES